MTAPDRPVLERTEQRSDCIAIARVLCILGVVYVHAWTGHSGAERAASHHTASLFVMFITENLLGRSSVPLLSMISAWLAWSSFAGAPAPAVLRKKARTLLLPMLAWNVLALGVVLVLAPFGLLTPLVPQTSMGFINEILPVTSNGRINLQTYFLRDLFVCMLFAPLLIRAPKALLAAIGAVLASAFVFRIPIYILIRPDIMLFFLLGLAIRRHDLPVLEIGRWDKVLMIAGTCVAAWNVYLFFSGYDPLQPYAPVRAVELLCRLVVAIVTFRICVALSRSRHVAMFRAIEPTVFFLFCSHALSLRLVGPIFAKVSGPFGTPGFLLLYLAEPLIALAAAWVGLTLTAAAAPRLANLLSGGRAQARAVPDARSRSAKRVDTAAPDTLST